MRFSWVNNLSLASRGLFLIAVAFSVQVIVIVAFGAIVDRSDSLNLQQHHHKELIGRMNWLSVLVVTSALSSIAHSTSGDKEYGQLFDYCTKSVNQELVLMAPVVKEDKSESKGLVAIGNDWQSLQNKLAGYSSATPAELKASIASGEMKTLWNDLFHARRNILTEEAVQFPVSKADFDSTRQTLKYLLDGVVVLDFLMALVVFYIFSLQVVRRIGVVADNSARLVVGAPLNQPLSGRDEIQRLDVHFHDMAGQLTAARNELEASEKRIRTILGNVPTGVLVLDADWHIEFCNQPAEELFGRSAEEFKQTTASTLFVSDNDKESLEQIIRNSRTKVVELSARKADESVFRAEISTKVIDFIDGEKSLIAVKDVTERYELERMKRDFVSMVCHDLRNPLASVRLFHDMIASGYLGELTGAGPKLLKNAQNCTDNLLTLTNDMLELDRLDYASANSGDLVLSAVKLDTIIEQAVGSAEGAVRPKNITVSHEPTEIELECDELKIVRVIGNLIMNAAKFSPEHSVVTIAVVPSGDFLKISVTDQGPGIPAAMHESIFDKFKQVNAKDARTGSGLGLAICKKFVENHNGKIGVISEPGQGSSFWFTLPRRNSSSKSSANALQKSPEAA